MESKSHALVTSVYAQKILKDAIELWGVDSQFGMLQEECAELIAAVNKIRRKRSSEIVISEIADVLIMCTQAINIFGDEKVLESIRYKLDRLEKKIESYKARQASGN